MHPVFLGISLLSAVGYSIHLRGKKALRFSLLYLLPTMLLAVGINMAFNHQGATLLAYFPSGNALTLESTAYGGAAAVMLAAVLLWFTCYNEVMTADKFVYLFGRVIPALSLVLSLTLRFVPKFQGQLKKVSAAQRCVGRDVSKGSLLQRGKTGLTILSVMITWSLENAIETADSMKSRGYGLKGRTSFSIYRFDGRDREIFLWLLFCGGYLLSGWAAGGASFRYYPTMKGVPLSPFPVSFMLSYLALCLTPLALDLWAERLWNRAKNNAEG
jgi:energy-coupling factor transport system permease protein